MIKEEQEKCFGDISPIPVDESDKNESEVEHLIKREKDGLGIIPVKVKIDSLNLEKPFIYITDRSLEYNIQAFLISMGLY